MFFLLPRVLRQQRVKRVELRGVVLPVDLPDEVRVGGLWLRTNGVNANGAAAKVMDFDRFVKMNPGTFGKIKVG